MIISADEKVKGNVSEKYGKFNNFPFMSIPTMDFNSVVGVHFSIRETTNCEKYAAQCLQLLLEEFHHANNSYNDGANGRPVTFRQVTVITSPVAT